MEKSSIAKFHTKTHALGPELTAVKRKRRARRSACGTERLARRHLVDVDGRVNLVSRTYHLAPVQEGITGKSVPIVSNTIIQAHAKFGNHREGVSVKAAAV